MLMGTSFCFRSIEGCYNLIKSIDPQTTISKYFIRDLCERNQRESLGINIHLSGNKWMIGIKSFFSFLGVEEQDIQRILECAEAME